MPQELFFPSFCYTCHCHRHPQPSSMCCLHECPPYAEYLGLLSPNHNSSIVSNTVVMNHINVKKVSFPFSLHCFGLGDRMGDGTHFFFFLTTPNYVATPQEVHFYKNIPDRHAVCPEMPDTASHPGMHQLPVQICSKLV